MQVDHVLYSLGFGVSAATLAQSRQLGHTAHDNDRMNNRD